MMNNVQLQGRVAFVNYKAGEGDKKSFISFAISYNTGRKENPTDQYNKEELYRCKAWGAKADFIHNYFPERSQILIDGQLMVGTDYTNNDGQLVKGGVEINIRDVHFCGPRENIESNQTSTQSTSPVKPSVAPKPVVAPKPAIKPVIPRR
jgi:single-stranded DNA-binding protein